MKKGTIFAGVFCGALCAVCVLWFMVSVYQDADAARQEAMNRYGGEQVEVVVATRDLVPGEFLDSSNSTKKLWLSDLLPEGCLTDIQDAKGKQLTSLVVKGEAVCWKRFESSVSSLEVPEGFVALTVPAKDVQAVGGALKPGALVDVYATGAQTSCLGRGVMVLATNADGSSAKESVSWVTLAVPSDQSQDYVSASQSMDISFTLPAVKQQSEGSSEETDGVQERQVASDQANQSAQ